MRIVREGRSPPPVLRARLGIPRFARRLVAGERLKIVAFGTSMTLDSRCGVRVGGRYLDPLLPALGASTGNARVELLYHGLEGFVALYATHRVRDQVIAHEPDLVLLEFAHNDSFLPALAPAMHGIIGQIQAALPRCEVALVTLLPRGAAAHGASELMIEYEGLADYFRCPSFDLASLAEYLVAEGRATWTEGERALTFDGTHHSALATELLGQPFARAFLDLIERSLRLPVPAAPVAAQASGYVRATSVALGPFADAGWQVGPASDELHCQRNAAAYVDEITVAREPGAGIAVTFAGTDIHLWMLCLGGRLSVAIDDTETSLPIPCTPPYWQIKTLATGLADTRHAVRFTALELPVVLGDLFLIGSVVVP